MTSLGITLSCSNSVTKNNRVPIVFQFGRINKIWFVILVFCMAFSFDANRTLGQVLPGYIEPGVRTGSNRFNKKIFLSLNNVGAVTDIQYEEFRLNGLVELGVVGNYGARFFDPKEIPEASVDFTVRYPGEFTVSARIVKPSRSNRTLFFRQAGASATYDSLVDSNGKELWRLPFRSTASTFGYVGRDGSPEFFFGSQDGAIEARDVLGKVLWRKEGVGWAFSMGIVNQGNQAISDMLLQCHSGKLMGLSLDGQVLFDRTPLVDGYFSDFSTIRWPGVCDGCILESEDDKFRLLASTGDMVVKDLAATHYLRDAHGLAVRLYGNAPPLLAIIGALKYKDPSRILSRGELIVFDQQGSLLYQEVFPEEAESLGVVPASDGKAEALLVGGDDKVWEYTAANAKTSGSH